MWPLKAIVQMEEIRHEELGLSERHRELLFLRLFLLPISERSSTKQR
jgi:hypothetical protein